MTGIDLYYVGSTGEMLNLNGDGIVCDPTEAISWTFDANEINGAIASFSTDIEESGLTVATWDMDARNRLYEIPAYDLENTTPGRLYVGEWYLICYVTASEQNAWWRKDGKATYSLTISADDPYWRRDTVYSRASMEFYGDELDFEYDFEHDFGYEMRGSFYITNENFLPADVTLEIDGPCTNPTVTIGENDYTVELELDAGESVIIDTYEKTVTVESISGDASNAFSSIAGTYMEGSGSYIFEKVPAGDQSVTWEGDLDFAITLTERRREPRWSDSTSSNTDTTMDYTKLANLPTIDSVTVIGDAESLEHYGALELTEEELDGITV